MSFKEKSAWVMFASLSVGAFFYAQALIGFVGNDDDINLISLVILYVVIIITVSIVGHIIAAVTSLKDAESPSDERDRIIASRANSISSYLLGFGAIFGAIQYLLIGDGDVLFHFILVSLTLSAVVEYALQIYFYRWGV